MSWEETIKSTGASAEVAKAIIAAGYDSQSIFQDCVKNAADLSVLLKTVLVKVEGAEGLSVENAPIHPLNGKLKKLLPVECGGPKAASPEGGAEGKLQQKGSKVEGARRSALAKEFEEKYSSSVWGSRRTAPGNRLLEKCLDMLPSGKDAPGVYIAPGMCKSQQDEEAGLQYIFFSLCDCTCLAVVILTCCCSKRPEVENKAKAEKLEKARLS